MGLPLMGGMGALMMAAGGKPPMNLPNYMHQNSMAAAVEAVSAGHTGNYMQGGNPYATAVTALRWDRKGFHGHTETHHSTQQGSHSNRNQYMKAVGIAKPKQNRKQGPRSKGKDKRNPKRPLTVRSFLS